ncbi:MAG: class II aldolase/adducin family protein [Pseudomonadota bacterium]
MTEKQDQLRREMIEICRIMHRKGLIAASDGNVSLRLDAERILITPSMISKGFMTADQIAVMDLKGNLLEGPLPPSSEKFMHLKAYELRPEIQAVIHAHPPLAIAATLAGVSLEEPILPEVMVTLGGIPSTPYATPASPQAVEVIQAPIKAGRNALVITRHGSLTLGKTLLEAYNFLEKVEHTAMVLLAARPLGPIAPLPEDEVKLLKFMGQAAGYLPLEE